MTFKVGSVYQIDFFGAPTTLVACMVLICVQLCLICCSCMPAMQERPANTSACAAPVAADQAFHPGHLHENPMQIYYINRTILGANTTLTNYWQARAPIDMRISQKVLTGCRPHAKCGMLLEQQRCMWHRRRETSMTPCTSLSFLAAGPWRLRSGFSQGPSQATPSSTASAPRAAAYSHSPAPSTTGCQHLALPAKVWSQWQLMVCMLRHWALSHRNGLLHAASSTTRTRAA